MNVALIQKAANRILAEPASFDMSMWAKRSPDGCGTTCCIAGHALVEAGARPQLALLPGAQTFSFRVPTARLANRLGVSQGTTVDAEQAAGRLLGLTWEETKRLFYASRWPSRYLKRYHAAKTDRGRARVAYQRIQRFIKTDGRV